jgi:predicted ABC-type ATPase
MHPQKPRLIVVAGPNGSGKTTVTEEGLGHAWFEGCAYINPDLIAQHELGGWNDASSVLQAAQKATDLRYALLDARKDIAFETVFSSPEKLDYLIKAKEAGYFIRLFFICTNSPEINAARIALRFMEGGHEVPINKIVSRYFKSLENVLKSLACVDRLYLYDNSVDGVQPLLIARFSDGKLTKQYANWPVWAVDFSSQTLTD